MFSEKLRILRKNAGLTQLELGEKLMLAPSTIGMYEQGRREPDSEVLVKISRFFDVSVDYLVDARSKKSGVKNIDELASYVGNMLREQDGLLFSGEPVDGDDIDMIVEAIRHGIHEAFEEKEK